MEFYHVDNTAATSLALNNCTLIVPCVSVGNVGQLACDLLINTLHLKKIGHMRTECILPIIGPNPFDSTKDSILTLSLELYHDEKKRLAVLQQRAPTVPGKLSQYSEELISWISQQNFAEVIMLTSCHAYERLDGEIQGSKVLFVAQEELHEELIRNGMSPLNQRKSEFGSTSFYMPGSGIAKLFYEYFVADKPKFTSAIFMVFCSEGDNMPEALGLLNAVNRWKLFIEDNENKHLLKWKIPMSWKHMFGSHAPKTIF